MESIFEELPQNSALEKVEWIRINKIEEVVISMQEYSLLPVHNDIVYKLSFNQNHWPCKQIELKQQGNIIYYANKRGGYKYMTLRFKRIQENQIRENNKELFGFRIIALNQYCQFYCSSSVERDIWVKKLGVWCIQINVNKYYKFFEEIGTGSYAKVHRAEHKSTGQIYAIKCIYKSELRQADRNIECLIQEINSMRNLNHPDVVQMYYVYEDEEFIQMVLQYCPAGELFTRIIKRKRLSEYNSLKVMKRLLRTLHYLHTEAKIIHRDLKPENLLLMSSNEDTEFKLADFGLSQRFDTDNFTQRCGSPGYVAPEILLNESYSTNVDIFSAGIVMYIILSGRSPFNARDQNELLIQNRDCNIIFQQKYWAHVTQQGMELVLWLTEPDQNIRPTAYEALQHPWFQLNKQLKNQNRNSTQLTVTTSPVKLVLPPASPDLSPAKTRDEISQKRGIGKYAQESKYQWEEEKVAIQLQQVEFTGNIQQTNEGAKKQVSNKVVANKNSKNASPTKSPLKVHSKRSSLSTSSKGSVESTSPTIKITAKSPSKLSKQHQKKLSMDQTSPVKSSKK